MLKRECNMDKPFVFISYSSKNKEIVRADVEEFQRRGYNVWLDDYNLDKTKASWKEDAVQAIQDMCCELVVFYVSADSLQSEACLREMRATVEEEVLRFHDDEPVSFIAVDVEEIGNIVTFRKTLTSKIKYDDVMSKEEKMRRINTQTDFIDEFFNSNNERVRIKPKSEIGEKEYYEEIIKYFPEEAKIFTSVEINEESPSNMRNKQEEDSAGIPASMYVNFPFNKSASLLNQPKVTYTFDLTVFSPINVDVYLNDEPNPIMRVDYYSGFSYKTTTITTEEKYTLIFKAKGIDKKVTLLAPTNGERAEYSLDAILTKYEKMGAYDREDALRVLSIEPNAYAFEQLEHAGLEEDIDMLLSKVDEIEEAYPLAHCVRAIGALAKKYKRDVTEKLTELYIAYDRKSSYGWMMEPYIPKDIVEKYKEKYKEK